MHDTQVYDAATAEQLKEQQVINYPTEPQGDDEAEHMDEDWDLPPGESSRTVDQKVTCVNFTPKSQARPSNVS